MKFNHILLANFRCLKNPTYIYFTITETVFQCKNEKNDEFCEQAWICDSRFRWKCMKSCNICFEGDYETQYILI